MNDIVTSIKEKDGFVSLHRTDDMMIEAAEATLGVTFSDEYRTYVSVLGVASYFGHELTGVCNVPALDVVIVTIQEREFIEGIPADWYVIEQVHIDGIVFWQAGDGTIYRTAPKTEPIKVFCSLLQYVNLG